eukprot:Plantae.Rhodophyta-Rhodochaete_pulchella.ctg5579.p2 GENE.Plantae.Rhodophyta-Rhodochaete_pulchella.ctg5579~~Plantae.Rhodophyta-Rhodochaete_pulchella.ctg5579.p2  ORF type:complete len:226 (-),score=18.00 Plantae.Rhodophyta-Rhodochaete_pulchella.ctg5579:1095-1772(-)
MKTSVLESAKPIQVKVRKYGSEQRDFLRSYVAKLEKLGLAYRNLASPWASAGLFVPKPGPERYRFTVDLRPVNSVTVPTVRPMPDLEDTTFLCSASHFASLDFNNEYWQIAVDRDSAAFQSILTPDGVYTPTRVIEGARNAVAHFQAVISEVFKNMPNVKQWIDDLMAHCTSVESLLSPLKAMFQRCREVGLKLHDVCWTQGLSVGVVDCPQKTGFVSTHVISRV